jgi:hypothetical protein
MPICDAFCIAIRGTSELEIASMISRSYGAFAVIHWPGSALDSLERIR